MSMIKANSAATPARVNTDNIGESWSPVDVRKGRDDNDAKIKVRSLNYNTRALRGGDWIVSRGSLMTLAVSWIEHGDKKYGLTVAHGFTKHGQTFGDSVFAFDSDDQVVSTSDGGKVNKLIKIGTIKSIDIDTDSLIFEIFPSIKIEPLAVALSGGDNQVCKMIVLPEPFATHAIPLPYDKNW